MTARNQQGFSLIEVMIAVVLLTVGVMALASGSAMVSRMIGRGRTDSMVAQVVSSRADQIRRVAASTTPPCNALASGNATTNGVTEQWIVDGVNGSITRNVRVITTYRTARRARSDTTTITLYCQ
jgi:prepilin-type N-terminal cleavage/methylation domain-containing protein